MADSKSFARVGESVVKTVLGNPHQSRVAECMNMTILERARSMRIHGGLPKQFWADAVNTTVYLINRGPSIALNYGIPKEALACKEVNMNHLRTFGCILLYVHVGLDYRSKLEPKSKRCIFLGYGISEYDYRFWYPENQKILRHKDVVFNEKKMYKDLLTESTSEKDPEMASWNTRGQRDAAESEFIELDIYVKKVWSIPEGNEELRVEPPTSQSELRQSTRTIRAPERCSSALHYMLLTDSGEPEYYD